MPNLTTNTGGLLVEPNWKLIYSDPTEIAAAAEYWRVVGIELRERDLLSPTNAHALQRLVMLSLLFDRAAREVAEHGAVIPASPGNPKSIARISPAWASMREAGAALLVLEGELGLTPRRRKAVTKVERHTRATRAADTYLRPIDGGKGRDDKA